MFRKDKEKDLRARVSALEFDLIELRGLLRAQGERVEDAQKQAGKAMSAATLPSLGWLGGYSTPEPIKASEAIQRIADHLGVRLELKEAQPACVELVKLRRGK